MLKPFGHQVVEKQVLRYCHNTILPTDKLQCILFITMMNLISVSEILKMHQPDLAQRGVKSLAIFGSLARGDATENSDIDLLVEFDRPVGLFEFIRMKFYLEELTQRRIDLVTPDALRPAMRDTIIGEAVHVS